MFEGSCILMRCSCSVLKRPHTLSSFFLLMKKYFTSSSLMLVKSTTVLQHTLQWRPCSFGNIAAHSSWHGLGMDMFIIQMVCMMRCSWFSYCTILKNKKLLLCKAALCLFVAVYKNIRYALALGHQNNPLPTWGLLF